MTEDPNTDPPEEPGAPDVPDSGQPSAAGDGTPDSGPEPSGAPPPYAPSEAVSGLVEPESGPPPEVLVGAAFAGGVALALILRRLTS